jgi:hypothetical protein
MDYEYRDVLFAAYFSCVLGAVLFSEHSLKREVECRDKSRDRPRDEKRSFPEDFFLIFQKRDEILNHEAYRPCAQDLF